MLRPGGPQQDTLTNETSEASRSFLKASDKHRVGFCSYIGLYGAKSQERRRSLLAQVIYLNKWLVASGIGEDQLVGLHITTDKREKTCNQEHCSAHIDVKVDVIQQRRDGECVGVLFSGRVHPQYTTVSSISEFFNRISRLTVPRSFRGDTWRVAKEGSTIAEHRD